MLNETIMMNKSFAEPIKRRESPQLLRPSAIPVSSKYPMYKEIMAAQERRFVPNILQIYFSNLFLFFLYNEM